MEKELDFAIPILVLLVLFFLKTDLLVYVGWAVLWVIIRHGLAKERFDRMSAESTKSSENTENREHEVGT